MGVGGNSKYYSFILCVGQVMRQIFEIPGRLVGLNEYINDCRRNKYAAAKIKKETQTVICLEIKRQKIKKYDSPIDVQIIWIEPNMKRDKDNISFAKKFILDSLVNMGIIQDDGWKCINNLSDKFYVNKREPRIVVILDDNL